MIDKEIKAGNKCNHCNGKYIVRINRNNGNKFIGCSNFPACNVYGNVKDVEKSNQSRNEDALREQFARELGCLVEKFSKLKLPKKVMIEMMKV